MDNYYVDALTEHRDLIKFLDNEILELLEKRVAAAKVIGDIKKMYNKPIYVPEVEKEKIAVLAKKCRYPGLVETIWPVIMCYTRSVE